MRDDGAVSMFNLVEFFRTSMVGCTVQSILFFVPRRERWAIPPVDRSDV